MRPLLYIASVVILVSIVAFFCGCIPYVANGPEQPPGYIAEQDDSVNWTETWKLWTGQLGDKRPYRGRGLGGF